MSYTECVNGHANGCSFCSDPDNSIAAKDCFECQVEKARALCEEWEAPHVGDMQIGGDTMKNRLHGKREAARELRALLGGA